MAEDVVETALSLRGKFMKAIALFIFVPGAILIVGQSLIKFVTGEFVVAFLSLPNAMMMGVMGLLFFKISKRYERQLSDDAS